MYSTRRDKNMFLINHYPTKEDQSPGWLRPENGFMESRIPDETIYADRDRYSARWLPDRNSFSFIHHDRLEVDDGPSRCL